MNFGGNISTAVGVGIEFVGHLTSIDTVLLYILLAGNKYSPLGPKLHSKSKETLNGSDRSNEKIVVVSNYGLAGS